MRNLLTLLSGGLTYFLRTYPSSYVGAGGIERYSSKPITNANGAVKCVVSKMALTKPFLLREYISNGLELSAYTDPDSGLACEITMVSPPQILVRVSSLTATTTNYVDSPEARTSSAKKASPSNSLSSPTAPRTESSRLDNRPTTVHASPPPQKTADVASITPTSAPTEPIQLGKIGSVLPVSTLIATGIHDTETPTGTGILAVAQDQSQVSSNSNPASRPGEPIPTVPVLQVSRTRPSSQVFGIPRTVALSPFSSLPIGSSSILSPSDSFPMGDQTFSRPINKPVTTSTSLGLPNTPDNPRPTSLSSILLTFTSPKFTIANPSEFSPSGTAEIHRGGSKITISGTQFISLGNSATITVHDDSSTTQLPVYTVGPLSRVPGSHVSVKHTSALQVIGIPETVALSPFSSLPIGSSSILNPSDSLPIGDQTFSRPNDEPVTTSTSLGLPNTPDNPRPTSLPSVLLAFTSQKFIVANPSEFSLSGKAEIHRGGSTITISGTGFISLGNSATVVNHDSSTIQLPVYTVGSLSQVPRSQVTANPTSALPPALTAAGNRSELYVAAQIKMAEVPMFIVLGATFFGIAAPWGLRY